MRTALLLLPLLLLTASRAPAQDDDREALRARIRKALKDNDERNIEAPDFGAGHDWLNVRRPLTLSKDLKGKIVVIDFWTYCCINCLHVLPDLAYLERKYAGKPVVVVGCHSAKFDNEAERDNIREAVLRYGIEHPVVVDKSSKIWRSFGTRSWPTIVIVGPNGNLFYKQGGEGQRERLDLFIEAALEYYGKKGLLNDDPLPIRLEKGSFAPGALAYPGKLLFHDGVLYVADTGHNRILALDPEGKFLWAAGSGAPGMADGAADEARFYQPQGMVVHDGGLLVADTENHAIRRIDLKTKRVTTLAGTGKQGYVRRGIHPKPREVPLSSPWALWVHEGGLYIAIAGTHQLWRMDLKSGEIGPWAGSGAEQRLDAPGLSAGLAQPSGLASDGTWLYYTDSESSSIRKARFKDVEMRTLVGGAENPRNLFRFGHDDGTGFDATLQHPLGVLYHQGKLYVADTYNHSLRVVDVKKNSIRTLLSGKDVFYEPSGLAASGDTLYVADTNYHRIRTVSLRDNMVATLELEGVPAVRGEEDVDPDAVQVELGKVQLKRGAMVELTLELGAQWKLTPGGHSRLRVGAAQEEIADGRARLPVRVAGQQRIQVTYYPCSVDGFCTLRTVVWKVDVEFTDGGKAVLKLSDSPE